MNKQIKLSLSIDEAKILHNGANQERKLEGRKNKLGFYQSN